MGSTEGVVVVEAPLNVTTAMGLDTLQGSVNLGRAEAEDIEVGGNQLMLSRRLWLEQT
jgi:hypothetical protein